MQERRIIKFKPKSDRKWLNPDYQQTRSQISSDIMKIHKARLDKEAFISKMKRMGIDNVFLYLAITQDFVKIGVSMHINKSLNHVNDRFRKLGQKVLKHKIYIGSVEQVADIEYLIKSTIKPIEGRLERFPLSSLKKIEKLIDLELTELQVKSKYVK